MSRRENEKIGQNQPKNMDRTKQELQHIGKMMMDVMMTIYGNDGGDNYDVNDDDNKKMKLKATMMLMMMMMVLYFCFYKLANLRK